MISCYFHCWYCVVKKLGMWINNKTKSLQYDHERGCTVVLCANDQFNVAINILTMTMLKF